MLIFHGRRVCEARRPRCERVRGRSSCARRRACSRDSFRHRSRSCPVTRSRGTMRGMTRIEIELYADRLSRHAERLRDDLEGARMRLAWLRLERGARASWALRDCAVLEALGVLRQRRAAERRLVDRRLRQLEVVERFQALVGGRAGADSDSCGGVCQPRQSRCRRRWAPARPAARRPRRRRGTGRPAPASRGRCGGAASAAGRACARPTPSPRRTGLASSPKPDRPSASTSGLPSRSPSP